MTTTTPTNDLSSFLGNDPQVDRLYDNVQVMIAGAGLSLIKMQSWNTIQDFYLTGKARLEHIFWRMAPNVLTIDFSPFDENWNVGWIFKVRGLSHPKLEQPSIIRDVNASANSLAQERRGEVVLSLVPSSYNAQLSSMLWVQWFETILAGVLYRLYEMPERPFSNPQLATYNKRRFLSGCGQARALAWAALNGEGRTWSFPYFAAGRPQI